MFAQSPPVTNQDVAAIFVEVTGRRGGRLEQVTYTNKIYGQEIAGRDYTAIQLCTASSASAVLNLLALGCIGGPGLVRQEDIRLSDFLANRFGHVFRKAPQIPAVRDGDEPPFPLGTISTQGLAAISGQPTMVRERC